jgi:hypothetical protein
MQTGSSISSNEDAPSQELLLCPPNPPQGKKKTTIKKVPDVVTILETNNYSAEKVRQQGNLPTQNYSFQSTSRQSPSMLSIVDDHNKSSSNPEIILATSTRSPSPIAKDNSPSSECHTKDRTVSFYKSTRVLPMGARLICEDTPNKTGELVLNTIFSMIKNVS